MRAKWLLLSLILVTPMAAHADDIIADMYDSVESDAPETPAVPMPDIMNLDTASDAPRTPCATAVMNAALQNAAGTISADAPEFAIRDWIYGAIRTPDVATRILNCPEIAGMDDDDTITFDPVTYTFPSGRVITIRRETQPRVLKQTTLLGAKRDIPTSPRVGTDDAIWTNTDPAWYGIMVVQSGALDDFIGAGRSNTISLDYIHDNIDHIYPMGSTCTSKSAIANNRDMVNLAVHKTVSMDDDPNDYYVAGDVNLQWITWGEVALDIAITVFTAGAGGVVLGATKGARATRAAKNLVGTIKNLEKLDQVRDYVRVSQNYARATDELKKIDRAVDAARHADLSRDIRQLESEMRAMERADDVKKYRQATDSFSDVMKYRTSLRSMRVAQRGNVIARAFRAARAANTGNKTIGRAAKLGRASLTSGRVRDWLFQSTLKNVGKLARVTESTGILYGAMKFAGDMYDWTESSTGKFTNNIEFSPLCLLSADDLAGYENVVNYGMWLMWMGDSMAPADDDAAYLQAMDFAAKFHMDLTETMDDYNDPACDVDIFVVRPIIRNPDTENAALYYLIMNDEPWSTQN